MLITVLINVTRLYFFSVIELEVESLIYQDCHSNHHLDDTTFQKQEDFRPNFKKNERKYITDFHKNTQASSGISLEHSEQQKSNKKSTVSSDGKHELLRGQRQCRNFEIARHSIATEVNKPKIIEKNTHKSPYSRENHLRTQTRIREQLSQKRSGFSRRAAQKISARC